MGTKQIKSWITVLSILLLAVAACFLIKRCFFPTVEPLNAERRDMFKTVSAGIGPSVVSLWAVKQDGFETDIAIIGCGLIVESQGLVLTSATLTKDMETLYIVDHEENRYLAEVVAVDEKTQLTLLAADTSGMPNVLKFTAVPLAKVGQLRSGDAALCLGGRRTPSGWELTTKAGTITDPRQSLVVDGTRYRDLIQTDIVLASENSGGPLVNILGEVVGFALPFVQPNSTSSFSYAVAAEQGAVLLSRLPIPHWTDGVPEPVCNWLGAEVLPVDPVMAAHLSAPDVPGKVVNHVQNSSPAERSGLKRGDIIIDINGKRITDNSTFEKTTLQLCRTDKTRLQVLRKGRLKTLTMNWKEPAYSPPARGSMAEVVIVVLIFSLMYYFVYKNVFDRVVLFVIGAVAVAITGHYLGFYEQDQMASALLDKLDVLLFIVGMQLVTGVLDEAGVLAYLAKKITLATGGNSWGVMWLFCLLTYGFSLFVNNLTTIMLMAPMVLSLSKYLECDPRPFLISMIIASNLGGASTMIGDFPNILIGTETGLPFYQFTSYMLPICLFELLVLLAYLRIARPSLFNAPTSLYSLTDGINTAFEPPDDDFPELRDHPEEARNNNSPFDEIKRSLPNTIKSSETLIRGLIILAIVIIAFLVSDFTNWSPSIIALCGGIIALAFGGCEPFALLQKVSIRDILFFSGLFVLVGAAEASGALGYMSRAIVGLSFGNTLVLCLLLMWAGAIVTCLLNAGPTTALFLPIVLSFKSAAPHSLYWWSLSLGVCAGSSGTLVGATAGSVAATMIDKFIKGQQTPRTDQIQNKKTGLFEKFADDSGGLTFKQYASLGLPVMLIFLLISSIYVVTIYRW